MSAHTPPRLPWRLLLLDLIGTLLTALGMYDLIVPGSGLLLHWLPPPQRGWALIAAGLVIMLPAVRGLLVFLARARGN